MSKLANQWIEIFRAGDYGAKGVFTEADLDQVVANYQPGTHEAPAVIGHPKENAPAYGWFDGVKRSGNVLLGKMSQVEPAFAELVEAGRYKKRSASFYRTPNGLSLRHVGWLGAQPPEVKGLADFKFADESESVELEFQESAMAAEDSLMTRLNAWFDEKFPKAAPAAVTTVATFSEADVKRIATEAVTAAVAPMQAKLDATELKFSEREKKIGSAETAARGEAAVARLKTAGLWVPAFEKLGLPLVFAELAKASETVEFGEADKDGKKPSAAPVDILLAFMEQLPKIVPNAAVYTGQRPGQPASLKGVNAGRAGVDEGSVRLHEAIVSFAEENKCSYTEAAAKVTAKHPELAASGGASAGSV